MKPVIPIRTAARRPADAVLAELLALLAAFATDGRRGSIDLPSRGITPNEAAELRERLGLGDVSARVAALGETLIHETAYAGIWWLSHRNDDGTLTAETIEVTDCPALLLTPRADVAEALARLQPISQRF